MNRTMGSADGEAKVWRMGGILVLILSGLIVLGMLVFLYAPSPKAVLGRLIFQGARTGDLALQADGALSLSVDKGPKESVVFAIESQQQKSGGADALRSRLEVNWRGLGISLEGFMQTEDLILKLPLDSDYNVLALKELMPGFKERFGLDFSNPGLKRDLNRLLPWRMLTFYNRFMDVLPKSDAQLMGWQDYRGPVGNERYRSLYLGLKPKHLGLAAGIFKQEVLGDGAVLEVLLRWSDPEKRSDLLKVYQNFIATLDKQIAITKSTQFQQTVLEIKIGYDWLYRPRVYTVEAALPDTIEALRLNARLDYQRQTVAVPKLSETNHKRINLKELQEILEDYKRFKK